MTNDLALIFFATIMSLLALSMAFKKKRRIIK